MANGSSGSGNGSESKVTVKFTFVLIVIAGLIGGFFTWVVNHESRITKTEVCVENLFKSTEKLQLTVESMDKTLDVMQRDQIRYYKTRDPNFKSVSENSRRSNHVR